LLNMADYIWSKTIISAFPIPQTAEKYSHSYYHIRIKCNVNGKESVRQDIDGMAYATEMKSHYPAVVELMPSARISFEAHDWLAMLDKSSHYRESSDYWCW
jgi:hypothetical protein